ncbi:MAG: CCA tRNA nucleotidyltransferase, partial [Desulfuromonadales bacterium]|nr:CCA tRNA nucleotidyltransferase [Desulfuromonadales bacterium]NIS43576.1 CCA tRNA nucleotidyltransferase [Desulfuromonadales bacterium]
LDPLGGAADLAAGILRSCSETVLQDDPLRVLKGVRHCQFLDLQPDRDTLERMAAAVVALPRAAPERIRAELGQILAGASSSRSC